MTKAEWDLEFGNITRNVRLEMPVWEALEEEYSKKKYERRRYADFDIFRFFVNDKEFRVVYYVRGGDRGLELSEYRWDAKDMDYANVVCALERFNEDGYIAICRKCKELFLD